MIRGRPGSGKSTALNLIEERLRSLGIRVSGIKTPEVRSGVKRVGFKVVDISTGKSALFASIFITSKYRVGRYGVDLDSFESIAIPALESGLREAEVLLIDEIGKMELLSDRFVSIIDRVWSSDKVAVGTIPITKIYFIEKLVRRSKVFWIERGRSREIADKIVDMISSHLGI